MQTISRRFSVGTLLAVSFSILGILANAAPAYANLTGNLVVTTNVVNASTPPSDFITHVLFTSTSNTDVADQPGSSTGASFGSTVSSASYTLTETTNPGVSLSDYTVTFSGACDANGNIFVVPKGLNDATTTCTITNTYTPPAPVTHTISYTASTGGSISGTDPQTVNDGTDGTAVTAVPASGYTFTNWSDLSTANPRTDTDVTGDINVTANFSPILSSADDITAFTVGVAGEVDSINGTDIEVTVPSATVVTSLTPTITTSAGATVSPNAGVSQDFTNPVQYTVTAQDTVTTQIYTVKVTVASAPIPTVTSVDSISTISVPFGTDLSTLIASDLPTAVGVEMSDASSQDADVTWDGGSPTYDGNTAQTYTFTGTLSGVANPSNLTASINVIVNPAVLSSDDALSALTVDQGSLSPTFDPATFSYTDNLSNSVSSITVTPTTDDSNATVTVNGNPASTPVTLTSGPNDITIEVTAQDGSTQNYDLQITRTALSTPVLTISSLSTVGYDAAPQSVTVHAEGGVTGTVNNIEYNGSLTPPTNAGDYKITADFASTDPNYSSLTQAPVSPDFNIAKAPLTITAQPFSKTYDGSVTAGVLPLVSTLKGTDSVSATETFDTANVGGGKTLSVSSDTVNDGNSGQNYLVTLVPSTGSIIQAHATVTLSNLTQTFSGSPESVTVTTGPVLGLSTSVTYDGSTTPPTNIGSYNVLAAVTDPNYSGQEFTTFVISPLTHTLTYTAGANGTITGTSPQTVNDGADGTEVTAVPASGFQFDSWSDASTSASRTDTDVTSDVTVTANFTAIPVSSGGGGGGGGGGNGPVSGGGGGGGSAPVALPGDGGATTTTATTGTTGTSGEVLGASTYNFSVDFGIGTQDQDVTQLQLILISDGFLQITTPTGYYGPMTQAAVKAYQAANGITPITGYVGPKTRAVLNEGTIPTTVETSTTTSATTTAATIQTLENELQALEAEIAALQK